MFAHHYRQRRLHPGQQSACAARTAEEAKALATDRYYVTEGPGLSAYALSDGTVYRASNWRWPTTACSTARLSGVKKKESASTGSVATTNTRCLSCGP